MRKTQPCSLTYKDEVFYHRGFGTYRNENGHLLPKNIVSKLIARRSKRRPALRHRHVDVDAFVAKTLQAIEY
jgi:hypothetical protein